MLYSQGQYVVAYMMKWGNFIHRYTPKVEVADTVGAGDPFTATFVVNILRGASVVESHRKAVDVSAYTCTIKGLLIRCRIVKSNIGLHFIDNSS